MAWQMPRDDWLPSREDELAAWFMNFVHKVPEYQDRLDLSPGDVIGLTADGAVVQSAVQAVALAKARLREWVEFKNLELYGRGTTPVVPDPAPAGPAGLVKPVAPGIVRRTRVLVAGIKAHPNFTDSIGDVLGVLGPDDETPDEVIPAGSVKALPGFRVEVRFVKARFDGVDIESRRRHGTRWVHLAFDSFSPYVDNRPPLTAGRPEQRHYRLRYRDNDVPVGDYSDTLNATATV